MLKRVATGLLIFIAVLFIFSQFFLDRYLERRALRKLTSIIVTGSDSLYRFSLEKLSISFWTGNISIENLKVKVDSARFSRLSAAKQLPALTFDLHLTKGNINGIKMFPFLFSKKITIGSIVPQNAEIMLSRHFYGSRQEMAKTDIPLWKAIEGDIKLIRVDKLVLDSVRLFYHNADSAKAFKWQFNDCSAVLNDIRIDSIGEKDTGRIMFTRDIAMIFKDVQLKTVDSLYNITAKKISYSSESQRLSLEQFAMFPALNRQEFFKKMGRSEDMFRINTEMFDVFNFRLQRWINNNEINADSINLSKPLVDIFFDRTLIEIPENRLGKYPPQLLLNAGVAIRVGKLKLVEADVIYKELSDSTMPEGSISFNSINGVITNITNHTEDIARNSVCTAELNCMFLQKSPLFARFDFFLNTTDGGFAVNGNLKNLSAAQVNPVTTALAKTQVQSLQLHNMQFEINGNEERAIGNMRMQYAGLNIAFNKKTDDGRLKRNKFLTKLINKYALRPQNPMAGEAERSANNIIYVRDPHKSFFSIVWRTMNACIQYITMNIIGLTS